MEASLGHYAPQAASRLSACPAGRYGGTTGLACANCTAVCPEGFYCPEGSTQPLACPHGSFGARAGLATSLECRPCTPGHFCISGTRTSCRDNSYNPVWGGASQLACQTCPHTSNAKAASNSSADCVCPAETFASTRAAIDGSFECKRAPAGTDSSEPGNELATLRLRVGYWRISRDAADVRRCPDAEFGNGSACAGGAGEHQALCRDGLHGIYCRECVDDSSHFSRLDSTCYACDGLGGRSTVRMMIGIVFACLLLILLCMPLQARLPERCKLALNRAVDRFWVLNKRLQGRLKIFCSFYQVAAAVHDTYPSQGWNLRTP